MRSLVAFKELLIGGDNLGVIYDNGKPYVLAADIADLFNVSTVSIYNKVPKGCRKTLSTKDWPLAARESRIGKINRGKVVTKVGPKYEGIDAEGVKILLTTDRFVTANEAGYEQGRAVLLKEFGHPEDLPMQVFVRKTVRVKSKPRFGFIGRFINSIINQPSR